MGNDTSMFCAGARGKSHKDMLEHQQQKQQQKYSEVNASRSGGRLKQQKSAFQNPNRKSEQGRMTSKRRSSKSETVAPDVPSANLIKYVQIVSSDQIKPGDEISVLTKHNVKCKAVVMKLRPTAGKCKVHFVGYHSQWDEWVSFKSRRLFFHRLISPEGMEGDSSRIYDSDVYESADSDEEDLDENYFQIHAVEFRKQAIYDGGDRQGECVICCEDVRVKALVCGHTLCVACLKQYVKHALGDASQFPLRCPKHIDNCSYLIQPADVRHHLTSSEMARFDRFNDESALKTSTDGTDTTTCTCPYANCNAVMVSESADKFTRRVRCAECKRFFCRLCQSQWAGHRGLSCRAFRSTAEGASEANLMKLAKQHRYQQCPMCKQLIEKSGGCNHIIHKAGGVGGCSQARTDFCYLCGVELAGLGHKYEKENPSVLHFPSKAGVFGDCVNVLSRRRAANSANAASSRPNEESRPYSLHPRQQPHTALLEFLEETRPHRTQLHQT